MKTVDSGALRKRYCARPEIIAKRKLMDSKIEWKKKEQKEKDRIRRKEEQLQNFNIAKNCEHFAIDIEDAPCLWHKSYCLHPDLPNTEENGCYETCTLVWHGICDKGIIAFTLDETEQIKKGIVKCMKKKR